MLERVREIFEIEPAAIRYIPITSSLVQAIEIIHRQVHEKSGKQVTSGMGKAGQIAHNTAAHGHQQILAVHAEFQHGL